MLNDSLGRASILALVLVSVPTGSLAQDIPAEYQQVLTALGKQGDYKANVLKVNIPRNDVSVTVAKREDAHTVWLWRLGRDDERNRWPWTS